MRFIKVLATLALTAHLVVLLMWNFPVNTAFKSDLKDPVMPYMALTGQWQIWKMFINKAHHSKYAVHIEARAADGTLKHFGSMLPGLEPFYDSFRVQLFFLNARRKGPQKYVLEGYAQKICRAIADREGYQPDSIDVVYDLEMIRDIHKIAQDGVIGYPKTVKETFGCL